MWPWPRNPDSNQQSKEAKWNATEGLIGFCTEIKKNQGCGGDVLQNDLKKMDKQKIRKMVTNVVVCYHGHVEDLFNKLTNMIKGLKSRLPEGFGIFKEKSYDSGKSCGRLTLVNHDHVELTKLIILNLETTFGKKVKQYEAGPSARSRRLRWCWQGSSVKPTPTQD